MLTLPFSIFLFLEVWLSELSNESFQNQKGKGIQNWYGERRGLELVRDGSMQRRRNLEYGDFWSSEEFPEGAGSSIFQRKIENFSREHPSPSTNTISAWLSGAIEAAKLFSKWSILHYSRTRLGSSLHSPVSTPDRSWHCDYSQSSVRVTTASFDPE